MKTNPNDTAYPLVAGDQTNFDDRVLSEGLNKREYFAAMAMQGICQNHSGGYLSAAIEAVKIADALITELNKAK